MARPLRIEYEGAFYHIIQRGIERKHIFLDDKDKKRFLTYLESANTAYQAVLHSYVLMDNHYHLILETPCANLSKIMHYVNTSYAVYYNARHRRVGSLYQGRYKSILVQAEEYLHYLSRYIHLNPLRANIVNRPEEYLWSSYRYFSSEEKAPGYLDTGFILSMFDRKQKKAKRLQNKTGSGQQFRKINNSISQPS
ncbi:MAG: transposase [Candidatus Aadella gelida]|nr:transposase [Candidatus Aadella gelida]